METIELLGVTYYKRQEEYQVMGIKYFLYQDISQKVMIAVNSQTGGCRRIPRCHKDITVRKAISNAFKLATFRK